MYLVSTAIYSCQFCNFAEKIKFKVLATMCMIISFAVEGIAALFVVF